MYDEMSVSKASKGNVRGFERADGEFGASMFRSAISQATLTGGIETCYERVEYERGVDVFG
jgi:hypothetical protein